MKSSLPVFREIKFTKKKEDDMRENNLKLEHFYYHWAVCVWILSMWAQNLQTSWYLQKCNTPGICWFQIVFTQNFWDCSLQRDRLT